MAVLNTQLNEIQKDVLREVANIGAGHSMIALADMTNETFILSVPDVAFKLLSECSIDWMEYESLAAAVYMKVDGNAPGHATFIFPFLSACEIAGLLLGRQHGETTCLEEMELSAIAEAGNILVSSFLNAISEMTGLSFSANPPGVAVDMFGAILASILSVTTSAEDHVLSIMTRIEDRAQPVEGIFLFIPEPEALPRIFTALGME
jgi:chemotaxis protein CheC